MPGTTSHQRSLGLNHEISPKKSQEFYLAKGEAPQSIKKQRRQILGSSPPQTLVNILAAAGRSSGTNHVQLRQQTIRNSNVLTETLEQRMSRGCDENTTNRDENEALMGGLVHPLHDIQVYFEQRNGGRSNNNTNNGNGMELQVQGVRVSSSSPDKISPRTEFQGAPRYNGEIITNRTLSKDMIQRITKRKSNIDAQYTHIIQESKDKSSGQGYSLVNITDFQVNPNNKAKVLKLEGRQVNQISKTLTKATGSDQDTGTIPSHRNQNQNQTQPITAYSNQLQYYKNMKILIENQRRKQSRIHSTNLQTTNDQTLNQTLVIPNDPTLVFKQDYFTMQNPSRLSQNNKVYTRKGDNNHLQLRSRSRNKTVLLMMKKNSKDGEQQQEMQGSEDEEESDGGTINRIVEDMGQSFVDQKSNKPHSNNMQWKSVARKCPLLVLDKTVQNKNVELFSNDSQLNTVLFNTATSFNQPHIEQVNYQPPSTGLQKNRSRTERLPQVILNNTQFQRKKQQILNQTQDLNKDLLGVSSTKQVNNIECELNPQLYSGLIEQVSQTFQTLQTTNTNKPTQFTLKTPIKKRQSFMIVHQNYSNHATTIIGQRRNSHSMMTKNQNRRLGYITSMKHGQRDFTVSDKAVVVAAATATAGRFKQKPKQESLGERENSSPNIQMDPDIVKNALENVSPFNQTTQRDGQGTRDVKINSKFKYTRPIIANFSLAKQTEGSNQDLHCLLPAGVQLNQKLDSKRRPVQRQRSQQLAVQSQYTLENSSPSNYDSQVVEGLQYVNIQSGGMSIPLTSNDHDEMGKSTNRMRRNTIMSRPPVTQVHIRRQNQETWDNRKGHFRSALQSRNSQNNSRLHNLMSYPYPHIKPLQQTMVQVSEENMPYNQITLQPEILSQTKTNGFQIQPMTQQITYNQRPKQENFLQAYMTSNLVMENPNRTNQTAQGKRYNLMGGINHRKNGAQVVESFNRRNTALIQFLKSKN